MSETYIYQVARIRCHEMKLLTKQDIDSLLSADGFDSALRVLFDKDFGAGTETTVEELLQYETKKLWDLMRELLKSDLSAFDVLLYPTDYNNLKAAIKSVASNGMTTGAFKLGGTVPPELFVKAVTDNEFDRLPKAMVAPAKQAYQTLLQTHDGQLCDIILDKACLENVWQAGQRAEDDLLCAYAELTVAIANIKVALRCHKMGKSAQFVADAMVKCNTLPLGRLAQASVQGQDELMEVLSHTVYSGAVATLQQGGSAFEKWCDDQIMHLVQKQKTNPFSIGPLIAFVIARQTEMNAVKLILSGKLNQIPNAVIKERLRDMYV